MRRIALVEDNPDNRLLLCALLEDDFLIDEYENGPTALCGMRASPPALVLLDISLPGMDGVEVLGHMKKDALLREIPVVAVTAHAMEGDRERFLAHGFDAYIPKPIVDDRVLFKTIAHFLEPG